MSDHQRTYAINIENEAAIRDPLQDTPTPTRIN
jgi:hypothetical protein